MFAALCGGIIGIERAHNGRPAGFRTHILVSLASALLMLLMQNQWLAIPSDHMNTIRVDPTRMAQGIMTGIGFLGAGVIIHEKHIVRGLTTSASIWITAAIGIIIGSGFFWLGFAATLTTLLTLSLFRMVEQLIPTRHYARLELSYERANFDRTRACELITSCGLQCSDLALSFERGGQICQLSAIVSNFDTDKFNTLQEALMNCEAICQCAVKPLEG